MHSRTSGINRLSLHSMMRVILTHFNRHIEKMVTFDYFLHPSQVVATQFLRYAYDANIFNDHDEPTLMISARGPNPCIVSLWPRHALSTRFDWQASAIGRDDIR